MMTMAISVALFALPVAAVAQPAAEADKSAKVLGLVVEAQTATTVSEVVVTGCTSPSDSEEYSTRSRRPVANAEFDAPAHPNGRTEESPGTRDFILRNIAGFSKGTADFDHMTEVLARITRTNIALEKHWIGCRGDFKNISFLHVSQDGFDDFKVEFSGAAVEWEVNPLNYAQKTDHWAARFYYPEPITRQFDGLLTSMERGRPSYDRLAPAFVPILQARWSTLQQDFKKWRSPHSMVFLRRIDDGSYVYKVFYGKHVVFWTVGPLDAAGKITDIMYDEGA